MSRLIDPTRGQLSRFFALLLFMAAVAASCSAGVAPPPTPTLSVPSNRAPRECVLVQSLVPVCAEIENTAYLVLISPAEEPHKKLKSSYVVTDGGKQVRYEITLLDGSDIRGVTASAYELYFSAPMWKRLPTSDRTRELRFAGKGRTCDMVATMKFAEDPKTGRTLVDAKLVGTPRPDRLERTRARRGDGEPG
jgi:hypothetical protein